ncbi:glycosyltransferase [Marinilongibacter aquaticus]|uniref:glycosyltransferase n=1 Tax=Marinilongibacter aquaticus TaxID=2975157 RepID=UPI0021BDA213|nr:glycosyltransferase [Marinilongibacter aquaticus]UBM58911.1 glycosyltransferase [Marinilongibacter aquaticus]
MPAPIVLFCFNRPDKVHQTVQSLLKNDLADQSELIVFCDGPRHQKDKELVDEVLRLVEGIKGFKRVSIHAQKQNVGLANSIIGGLNTVFENAEQAIVLEDDILVSRDFLTFMNTALERYENEGLIGSVSGYSFKLEECEEGDSYFLVKRASSWGWGTWRNRWQSVDWQVSDFPDFIKNKPAQERFMFAGKDQLPMLVKQQRGEIQSWAVRWTYHHFLKNQFCLVPKYAKVRNIGTDGSGTNFTNSTEAYSTDLNEGLPPFPKEIKAKDSVQNFIKVRFAPSLLRKCINFFKYRIWY